MLIKNFEKHIDFQDREDITEPLGYVKTTRRVRYLVLFRYIIIYTFLNIIFK